MNTLYKSASPKFNDNSVAPVNTNSLRDFCFASADGMPFFDKYCFYNKYLFDAIDHNENILFWVSRKIEEFLIFTICHFFPSLGLRYYPVDMLGVETVSFALPELALDLTTSVIEAFLSVLSYVHDRPEDMSFNACTNVQKCWSNMVSILSLALVMLLTTHFIFINSRAPQLNKSAVSHRYNILFCNTKVWW